MRINYWHTFEEGLFYHIYNHSVSNRNLFEKSIDYEDFLNKYNKYVSHAFNTYAFCLMPNHFHFVVQVKNRNEILDQINPEESVCCHDLFYNDLSINKFIQDQFRRYFSSYSLSFNHRNKTRGQLFLKKMKRVCFDPELKLEYLICYVHHNPIHHSFVKNYKDWKFSSYKNYLGSFPKQLRNMKLESHFLPANFLRAHQAFKINYND